MSPETRNMIAAMSLSLAILIGWQIYFVDPPKEQNQNLIQEDNKLNEKSLNTDLIVSESSENKIINFSKIEKDKGKRIEIIGSEITGSISTMGARIDDIVLTNYTETLDKKSPSVKILNRIDSNLPYFAEFGWVSAKVPENELPNSKTIWNANNDVLTIDKPLKLEWNNKNGLIFEKIISINEDYLIKVVDNIYSKKNDNIDVNPYGLIRRTGTPKTEGLYILHEGPLGVFDETLNEQDYNDLLDLGNESLTIKTENPGGWIGITDKYWLAALIPSQDLKQSFSMKAMTGNINRYQTDFIGKSKSLESGGMISSVSHFFIGAKKLSLLDKYSNELKISNFDLAIDFGWFYFLTKPFFFSISWLFEYLGNFGLAIIAFTILVRLALFPLANKSFKSMGKMKDLAPKIQKMREDYGSDKQKLNKEMMELYKKEKVNPAAGCLPILLQIPVFFALYKVLYVSIEMRHAPFFGWIKDLSAVDPTSIWNLFGLLPYSVDFMPQFLSIGIWPILMGLSMALQMRLNPPPPDPIQAKIFQWMPFFFTFLLAGFPSGLVIYWTWNNLLSITQQWWITRSISKKAV